MAIRNYLRISLAALCLGCALGCNTPKRSANNDPLLGGGPAVQPTGYTNQPKNSVKNDYQIEPPPMTSPYSTTSTAALAAGVYQPIDSSREVRIPRNTNPDAGNSSWIGKNKATETGIVLNQPEPLADSDLRPDVKRNEAVLTSTTNSSTVEQLLSQLRQRKPIWMALDLSQETGEWKCTYIVPNPQKPGVQRTYEAYSKDAATAVRAVLERLDE
jgi:hypothetical protein